MANLDSRFICISDLELLLRDNATGLPLSGGIVTFYSDVNRTVLKPVYQLTGVPGNYTYAVLNNPCTLSSAGTFQDALGNNIVPYYYPFTGTPTENTGEQELYYVTVVNSGFVPQFVRQGWPQAAGSGVTPDSGFEIDNLIPNGQFLAHNDPLTLTEPPIVQWDFPSETVYGQPIAQGGWYFAYTAGTTAVFDNSFEEIPSAGGWGMNSFPRYVFNFKCTSIGNNPATKDLRIIWPDVNKLSSGNPPGESTYTLFFDSRSNDDNAYTFSLYRIYYYGTGDAPSNAITELISTITVGPNSSFASRNIQSITFPANQGTIGSNGDDYVALSLRGPSSGWNVSFTDFALVPGDQNLTSFPIQTNDEMLSRGVAGFMPTPDPTGLDLYLPLVLTPQGMTFDITNIGKPYGSPYAAVEPTELACDGTSYRVGDYSSIGIPYARLANRYFNTTNRHMISGCGYQFADTYASTTNTALLFLNQNSAGVNTFPADAVPVPQKTGFTFTAIVTGIVSANQNAYTSFNTTSLLIRTNALSTFAAPTAGNSGFTVTALRTAATASQLWAIAPTAASAIVAGHYFTFATDVNTYYVWFTINGAGADPAPGPTVGIKVDLLSTWSAAEVTNILLAVLNSAQSSRILCTSGATVPAGSYFTLSTNVDANDYYVWYKVNDLGTEPVIANANGIQVDITSAMTSAQVAAATQTALNMSHVGTPDMRGLFMRGYDPTKMFDQDAQSRGTKMGDVTGNSPSTFEVDAFLSHQHGVIGTIANYVAGGASSSYNTTGSTVGSATALTGGDETRPYNWLVYWVIKY